MSEVQSRPHGTRGRGSYRGGRGGYRGARNGSKTHTKGEEQDNMAPATLEDQGEVGELKKKYGNKVPLLREVCPGWSDEDLVFALNETEGNVDLAFDRISSGTVSQWGEVKKKPAKPKESVSHLSDSTGGTRGGRGRGNLEGRGRGRGNERGRGRGARATSQTNGTKSAEKTTKATLEGSGDTSGPTTESTGGWDSEPVADTPATGDWANDAATDGATVAPPVEEAKAEPAPPVSKKGGWAGLFAKPPPALKKAAPVPVVQPEEPTPPPAIEEELPSETMPPDPNFVEAAPAEPPEVQNTETPIVLTPSKDELTETNLERLPDVSHPVASQTAASTVASTQDPMSSLPTATPAARPGISGYAASALKATSGAGRSASFQRRVVEQQEAVVMPGNHAVDRAAVQFGSMGLNGTPDDVDVDVDEDREDPETRIQMPDDSPGQPRASLPPSQHEVQAPAPIQQSQEDVPTQRQAPGLPPVHQQISQSSSPPTGAAYADAYRYGQSGPKAYNPFAQPQGQQAQTQAPAPSQEPFSNQVPSQAQPQMPSGHDYSSYYGANARDPYPNYYGSYAHGQEAQPRSGSAFGTSGQEAPSQYATSRPQHTYGQPEAQNSGHNTPNPASQGHQAQHSQNMPQNQSYGGYAHGYNAYGQQYPQYGGAYGESSRYGAGRPNYDDVRRQDPGQGNYYNNQYAYGHNQQYGGYNKASMYGQSQQQYAYEHSSSPANAGGYGQSSMTGRDAVYGRTGSTQPSEAQQQSVGNSAFGGMPDPFGRSQSGFGQQLGGSEDAPKYDSAKPGGPSPATGQSNRPGSAINSMAAQQTGQSAGYPGTQSHTGHQAFGGYPQYGGQHQAQANHPQSSYGGYGSNNFAQTYGGYGSGSGRGWNGTYGGGH